MIWRHEGCTSKRAHVPPAAFSPEGPEGPRGEKKKNLTGLKANDDEGRAGKSDCSPKRQSTTETRWARGPGRVRGRLLPSPRAPLATGVSPPPRRDPRGGRAPGGRHILRPGLGVGWGRELSIPAGPPGGDPGPQRRSPPSRTPPCGPARPPQRPAQVSP